MAVDMSELVNDLLAETAPLQAVLQRLDDAGWDTPTPAVPWSVRDQISHLAYFDQAAVVSATDPERFRAERSAATDIDGFTEAIAEQHRSTPGAEVRAWLMRARQDMIDAFSAMD